MPTTNYPSPESSRTGADTVYLSEKTPDTTAELVRERLRSMPVLPPELLELADVDRDLTEEEIIRIFNHIPLFVVADDEDIVRRALVRGLKSYTGKGGKEVRELTGTNATESVSDLCRTKSNELPIITCKDGAQAEAVLREIGLQGIPSGVIVMDDVMPEKAGLEVLRECNSEVPPGFSRILQSGYVGSLKTGTEIDDATREGSMDSFVPKPYRMISAHSVYAKSFLRRQRRGN